MHLTYYLVISDLDNFINVTDSDIEGCRKFYFENIEWCAIVQKECSISFDVCLVSFMHKQIYCS